MSTYILAVEKTNRMRPIEHMLHSLSQSLESLRDFEKLQVYITVAQKQPIVHFQNSGSWKHPRLDGREETKLERQRDEENKSTAEERAPINLNTASQGCLAWINCWVVGAAHI